MHPDPPTRAASISTGTTRRDADEFMASPFRVSSFRSGFGSSRDSTFSGRVRDPGHTACSLRPRRKEIMEMTTATPSLAEALDRLARVEPSPFPVVSLYLNAQPDNRGKDHYAPFVRKEL